MFLYERDEPIECECSVSGAPQMLLLWSCTAVDLYLDESTDVASADCLQSSDFEIIHHVSDNYLVNIFECSLAILPFLLQIL